MACPYFHPLDRLDDKRWPDPPRLPLGDPYSGICRAPDSADFAPDDSTLREFCNMGYARQSCSRFPQRDGPDAVRFLVSSHLDQIVQIAFVVERDHRPYQHGTFASSDSGNLSGEVFRAQAEAYLSSYRRRKA
jgi:hypothetical protein